MSNRLMRWLDGPPPHPTSKTHAVAWFIYRWTWLEWWIRLRATPVHPGGVKSRGFYCGNCDRYSLDEVCLRCGS